MDKVELLRKILSGDRFVDLVGIEIIDVNDDRAIVRAEIGEKHLNAHGSVQGGMIFTIADFAFAAICNYKHPITVTQVSNLTFIKAAKSHYLTCEARELTRNGRNCITEVAVRDDDGDVVAMGNFNGFIKEASIEEITEKYITT